MRFADSFFSVLEVAGKLHKNVRLHTATMQPLHTVQTYTVVGTEPQNTHKISNLNKGGGTKWQPSDYWLPLEKNTQLVKNNRQFEV